MHPTFVTCESVTRGHPDKVCDTISDAILDAYLAIDPRARVAVETLAKSNTIFLAGEISASPDAAVDLEGVVRSTVKSIGYRDPRFGFCGDTAEILTRIERQSPDIARGVDTPLERRGEGDSPSREIEKESLPPLQSAARAPGAGEGPPPPSLGAGDQGIVFGYATDETPEMLPLALVLAHKLARGLEEARVSGRIPYLRPDGKAQVTLRYGEGEPRVAALVLSSQHDPDVPRDRLTADLRREVIARAVPERLLTRETQLLLNPTGQFVLGGPAADTGLTGRKIIVDSYGGVARHGGGAFSGKDPTKVDRSGAYAARFAAKNLVAAGLAHEVEISVAYAIGVAHPLAVTLDSRGTGAVPDEILREAVCALIDLRPGAILRALNLRRPIYTQTAAYGHFGRDDLDLPWEKTSLAPKFRSFVEERAG